jgi:hypothetical protein
VNRTQHLDEMRYALEHQCSLKQARDALARLKWLAGQAVLEQPRHVMRSRCIGRRRAIGAPDFWWTRE